MMLPTAPRALAFTCAALLLVGCASAPWEGMSEREISSWQSQNVSSDWARAFERAGVSASDYEQWSGAGIPLGDEILDWLREGFDASGAGGWKAAGFVPDDARDWVERSFSAEEAKRWRDAGFSLRKAVSERAKGLAPIG